MFKSKLLFILSNISFSLCAQYNLIINDGGNNYIGNFNIIENKNINLNYEATMVFPKNVIFEDLWFCDENKPYCLVICEKFKDGIEKGKTICDVNNKIIANFYYNVNGGMDAFCNYPLDLETIYYGSGKDVKPVCGISCNTNGCNKWTPPDKPFKMGPP